MKSASPGPRPETRVENLVAKQQIVIECLIGDSSKQLTVPAFIDQGCDFYALVSPSLAQQLKTETSLIDLPLNRLISVDSFNYGQTSRASRVIHPQLTVCGHTESLAPCVILEQRYPLMLGLPWLEKHGVWIDGPNRRIEFKPGYCDHIGALHRCKDMPPLPTQDQERQIEAPKETLTPALSILTDENKPPMTEMTIAIPRRTPTTLAKTPGIHLVGAAPFHRCMKMKGATTFSMTMKQLDEALAVVNSVPTDSEEPTEEENVKRVLPAEYHDLIDVFSKKASNKLPEHRPYDHHITLEGEQKPGYCPLYPMSREELEACRQYIIDNLRKGFIQSSNAPYASPVLFVKKPNGELRLCVDYRKLNALTRKDRYPLPLIEETLASLRSANIFTKLDVIQAFHRIRMATNEDEDLTTFRTRFGSYKFSVMPFGLTNGPATFQHYINDTLWDYLDVFCTAYVDDILIYSNDPLEHQMHVRKVLERLRSAGLQVDIKKCEFGVEETRYLGLIVGVDGIRPDPQKIEAIRNWAEPTSMKELQSFLGFCNFYRRFIRSYSRIAAPLVKLTKRDQIFLITDAGRKALEQLKEAMLNAPVLAHFDPHKRIVIETDSSDYVSAGVMSQEDENGVLRPIAFFSKKLSPAECNYEIYDKELLAIIRAFEEWRPELEGHQGLPIEIITDHKALEYFMTTKQLNRRQARWAEYLSRFSFVIKYNPGKNHQKADALTRLPGVRPQNVEDDRIQHQHQTILKPHQLDPEIIRVLAVTQARPARPLAELLDQAIAEDELCQETLKLLRTGARESKKISLAWCSEENNRLLYKGAIWIPPHDELRLALIQAAHDSPEAGHAGDTKTLSLLRRRYYWPRMDKTIEQYIRNCHTCKRTKPQRETQGLLQPLSVAESAWTDITMDFVTGLPDSDGKNSILVVVDRLTKMRHFIACATDSEGGTSAAATARMLVDNVWKLHGLPESIVSDRGPQFVSDVWKQLCRHLRIEKRLSTAYHPQTDGQSENANAGMERYLRAYTNYLQDDWTKWLAMSEFAINNQVSESTKVTPFFATFGRNPRMSFEMNLQKQAKSARERLNWTKAFEFANRMTDIHDFCKGQILKAQLRQEEAANRSRRPHPAYKKGDLVWLSTKNIRTKRPNKKLDYKQIGPFEIDEVVSPLAYRLRLPDSAKIHPTIHASLLRPCASDPLPGQNPPPPPPVEIDEEAEWELDDILDSRWTGRGRNKRLQYKVAWKGYPSDDTFYDADGFEHANEIVADYHARYPERAKRAD